MPDQPQQPLSQEPDFNMDLVKQHYANLSSARKEGIRKLPKNIKKIKKNLKDAVNLGSLTKQIDPFMDWLFGIALTFAILKDILDIVNTALIAAGGIGWLLIIIFTSFCSFVIFFIMLLTGASGKKKMAKGIAKRILLLTGTTLAEFVPGVDLLPMESLVVVIIFWMTLNERRVDAQEKELENAQFA